MGKVDHHARRAHHAVTLAATPHVEDKAHETPTKPATFELSSDQLALVRTLDFFSPYQLAHTPRTSSDVASAFDANALSAIEQNAELGGPARAKKIQELVATHEQLIAIAAVVGPLAALVGQNLLVTDAALAREAGEPLKIAHSLHASKPALAKQLGAIETWSSDHHRKAHSHAHAAQSNAATPPANAATPPST